MSKSRWFRFFLVGQCAAAILITWLLFSGQFFFLHNKSVPCSFALDGAEVVFEGKFACFTRGLIHSELVIRSIPTAEAPNKLHFILQKSSVSRRLTVDGQAIGGPNYFNMFAASTLNDYVASSSGTGTEWSANARIRMEVDFNPNESEIWFYHTPGRGPVELRHFMIEELATPVTKTTGRSTLVARTEPSLILWGLTALMLVCLGGLLWMFAERRAMVPVLLSASFFLITIYAGMPFLSNVGSIDVADDLSYAHWAYNIGYRFNPYLATTDIPSWTKNSNIHSWGTGLFFAPFLMPMRLIWSDLAFGGLHTYAMSFASIFYALGSIFLYFCAFRHISSVPIAAFLAPLTICGTSLLKWTYARNVFSHAPEAFSLAMMTWLMVRLYVLKSPRRLDYFALLLAGILAVQVRRENILFVLLPIYYEIFFRWRKEHFIARSAGFLATALLSLAILRMTNYFANVPSFWKEPTGYLLHFHDARAYFDKNFWTVVFDGGGALFSWWQPAVIIACLAPFLGLKFKIYLPLVGMIVAYVTMCILHDFPTAAEWQNRFLLKLNPITFAGTAYVLQHVRWKAVRLALGAWLAGAALWELWLYQNQIERGLAFYKDFISDSQVALPWHVWANESLRYFLVPLLLCGLVVFCTITVWKIHVPTRSQKI